MSIDCFVGLGGAIQQHSLETAELDIDVFDTTFLLEKLLMLTGLPHRNRIQERTTEALGAIAIGMIKLVGGEHAQPSVTTGGAISFTIGQRVAMSIDWNSRDATMFGTGLVDIPSIKGSISGDLARTEA
nr:hypothetical protein [Ktedonosporobacter rubrisoli]